MSANHIGVRCSRCKTPFKNTLMHDGTCDMPGCRGIAERYTPDWRYDHECIDCGKSFTAADFLDEGEQPICPQCKEPT